VQPSRSPDLHFADHVSCDDICDQGNNVAARSNYADRAIRLPYGFDGDGFANRFVAERLLDALALRTWARPSGVATTSAHTQRVTDVNAS
jgi:hypothetical protein